MPSLKMKTKLSTGSLREKNGLHVCQKSNAISKTSCSRAGNSPQIAELDICIQNSHNVALSTEGSAQDFERDGTIDQQDLLHEESYEFQKRASIFLDSTTMERGEPTQNSASNVETIFSPFLEPVEVHGEKNIENDTGNANCPDMPGLGNDDNDNNRSSCGNQTCNVSDFFISDMIIASLPLDENGIDDYTEPSPLGDHICAEPNMFFDMAEQYMILPFLEETAKTSNMDDVRFHGGMMDPDNTGLFLAIDQMKSCNEESDIISVSDQAEDFDPQLFIKNLPELSDVVSSFRPTMLPRDAQRRKAVTLVLDLDETLVHSTLEHCDDAHFTFTVFFNMKEHTVYVKQRPHLHTFLEKVAEMFEVVIFTASQSIYAAQLLDILDPDGKFISRRVYRESCIFSDGSYTKDLTVLGVDLAKVAIIDNSPQVFRLQVNNGIPIKSWFDDPSDNALISLLPFLETLVDADDVRPIIAKRFGNKE